MTTNQADRHERQEPHQPTTFSDPSIQHPPGDGAKKWLPPGDEWCQTRGQIVTNVDKSDKTRSNPNTRVKKKNKKHGSTCVFIYHHRKKSWLPTKTFELQRPIVETFISFLGAGNGEHEGAAEG